MKLIFDLTFKIDFACGSWPDFLISPIICIQLINSPHYRQSRLDQSLDLHLICKWEPNKADCEADLGSYLQDRLCLALAWLFNHFYYSHPVNQFATLSSIKIRSDPLFRVWRRRFSDELLGVFPGKHETPQRPRVDEGVQFDLLVLPNNWRFLIARRPLGICPFDVDLDSRIQLFTWTSFHILIREAGRASTFGMFRGLIDLKTRPPWREFA